MGYCNIKIDSSVGLHIKNDQLVIGDKEISFPLEDINCVLIENQSVAVSAYMLQKFASQGIALYVCDERHLPNAVLLPMVKHSRHFKMLTKQMEVGKPLIKRLWQQIIIFKIKNQALCLKNIGFSSEYEKLLSMTKEVQSGDKTHVEAKAAAYYFRILYGEGFTRADECIVNSAMNYAYAIIRGLIARSIVCYGLEPSIGMFHHSELNSFNLADDLIEVFRPLVDLYVASYFDMSEVDADLTPQIKRDLFNIINYDMSLKGEKRIISNCIDILVYSYNGAIQGNRTDLELPELIPLQVHSYE